MTVAYVVTVDTGQYSDHQSGLMAVFTDEAEAQAYVDAANAWLRERGYDRGSAPWDDAWQKDCPFPIYRIDYTGAKVSMQSVPMWPSAALAIADGRLHPPEEQQ